ncbi:MAG TPA: hypothetical protein VN723_05515 [Rhizomicrobium sp.]|nr:hypothetical protein [Rhizomicrobium sp.]
MRKSVLRYGLGIFAMLWIIAFVSLTTAWSFYTWHRSSTPDAKDGRLYKVEVNYGKRVFVTAWEQRVLEFSEYLSYGALLLIVIGLILEGQDTLVRKK